MIIAQGFSSTLNDGSRIRPAVSRTEAGAGLTEYQGGLEINGMFARVAQGYPEIDQAIEAAIDSFDYWSRWFGGIPEPLEKTGQ